MRGKLLTHIIYSFCAYAVFINETPGLALGTGPGCHNELLGCLFFNHTSLYGTPPHSKVQYSSGSPDTFTHAPTYRLKECNPCNSHFIDVVLAAHCDNQDRSERIKGWVRKQLRKRGTNSILKKHWRLNEGQSTADETATQSSKKKRKC